MYYHNVIKPKKIKEKEVLMNNNNIIEKINDINLK